MAGDTGVRIVRVTNQKDLVQLYRFRYRVFVEELGWMARKDRGAHILVDEFDTDAAEYAAYERATGQVVGSVRAIADGPLGLPLERCRVLDGYREDKRLVELSRLAVAPRYRGTMLAATLMKAGFQWADRHGATHVVLDTYTEHGQATERLYLKLGFEQLTRPYKDPDYLWKESVVTLALDIEAAKRDWRSLRPSLLHFFTSEDECIDHSGASLRELKLLPRRQASRTVAYSPELAGLAGLGV